MSYIIIAEFKTLPGAAERFQDLMTRHAYRSMALEDGCYQFDVVRRVDAPSHFILYERYADEAAYGVHHGDPRHDEILAAITPLVEQRDGKLFWSRIVAAQVHFQP